MRYLFLSIVVGALFATTLTDDAFAQRTFIDNFCQVTPGYPTPANLLDGDSWYMCIQQYSNSCTCNAEYGGLGCGSLLGVMGCQDLSLSASDFAGGPDPSWNDCHMSNADNPAQMIDMYWISHMAWDFENFLPCPNGSGCATNNSKSAGCWVDSTSWWFTDLGTP